MQKSQLQIMRIINKSKYAEEEEIRFNGRVKEPNHQINFANPKHFLHELSQMKVRRHSSPNFFGELAFTSIKADIFLEKYGSKTN